MNSVREPTTKNIDGASIALGHLARGGFRSRPRASNASSGVFQWVCGPGNWRKTILNECNGDLSPTVPTCLN